MSILSEIFGNDVADVDAPAGASQPKHGKTFYPGSKAKKRPEDDYAYCDEDLLQAQVDSTNNLYLEWLKDGAKLIWLATAPEEDDGITVKANFKTWVTELREVLKKAPKTIVEPAKSTFTGGKEFDDLWFMKPDADKADKK